MIRRYPCQIVLMSVFGILFQKGLILYGAQGLRKAGFWMAACSVAAFLAAAVIWLRREPAGRRRLGFLALFLAAGAAGAGRMHAVFRETEQALLGAEDGQEVSVQGRIIKKQCREIQEETSECLWTVHLTDCYRKTSDGIRPCGTVTVYLDQSGVRPVIGNTILVSGKIKLYSSARNDGNFDARAYYQNMGYSFQLYADKDSYQTADAHADRVREFLYDVQGSLRAAYERAMPEEEAGVLSAMLLGEKSLLSNETKELYRRSGIAHILAISGLHISVLGAAVLALLRKTGLSVQISSAVSVSLLVLFALMSGMSVSTVRAVIMFAVYLGAACCGRAYDSVNGLAAAAACILLQNPRALFLAGFQFSFAAVAGVWFGKEICRIFRPKFRPAQSVFISFGIQLLTLPLTAWYYFEIPVYSLLLNMLVLPFMELVLVFGLLGGAAGLPAVMGAPAAAAFAGGLFSKGLLSACTFFLGCFRKAGGLFLKLPGAVFVIGQPHRAVLAGYYLVLGAAVLLISRAEDEKTKDGKTKDTKTSAVQEGIKKENRLKRQKRAVVSAGLLSLCMLFIRLPKQARADILDTGQGDGIYLHTSDGTDVFIDGGSSDVKGVGTYRILPFLKSQGVSSIDHWFVSHLDQDHISGLTEAVESGFAIGQVVFAKGVLKDEAYDKLTALLNEHRTAVAFLGKGDVLRGTNACFTCLAPDDTQSGGDRNARSLVLLYEDGGFSAFFPGDISADEERRLLADGKLKNVTLYKAAHHGSKYSNSAELLKRLSPAVSAVSCAEENDYGHPGKEAVSNMEQNSAEVYYTMRSGRIRLRWGRKPAVETWLGKQRSLRQKNR